MTNFSFAPENLSKRSFLFVFCQYSVCDYLCVPRKTETLPLTISILVFSRILFQSLSVETQVTSRIYLYGSTLCWLSKFLSHLHVFVIAAFNFWDQFYLSLVAVTKPHDPGGIHNRCLLIIVLETTQTPKPVCWTTQSVETLVPGL